MATLLVGLLVVPLATSFAGMVGEARTVRQRAEGDPAGHAASRSAEALGMGSAGDRRMVAAGTRASSQNVRRSGGELGRG